MSIYPSKVGPAAQTSSNKRDATIHLKTNFVIINGQHRLSAIVACLDENPVTLNNPRIKIRARPQIKD